MVKSYIIGGVAGAGVVVAIAALLAVAYHHEFSEAAACKSTMLTAASPSGRFRAEMKDQVCRWGFGFAANTVNVKVQKLGKGGWFYVVPLEYDALNTDQDTPRPTMQWVGSNTLRIVVHSRDTSGTLERTSGKLTVTRSYIKVSQG